MGSLCRLEGILALGSGVASGAESEVGGGVVSGGPNGGPKEAPSGAESGMASGVGCWGSRGEVSGGWKEAAWHGMLLPSTVVEERIVALVEERIVSGALKIGSACADSTQVGETTAPIAVLGVASASAGAGRSIPKGACAFGKGATR